MSTSNIDAENLCVPNPAVQTINAISSRHSFQSFSCFFFVFFKLQILCDRNQLNLYHFFIYLFFWFISNKLNANQ